MAIDPYSTAAGLVLGAGGAFLSGRAGDITRHRIQGIADTPGLDIGAISAEAQANQQKLLPGAESLVRTEAVDRQKLINDLIEQSMPGFTEQRDKGLNISSDLLAGNIPADVSEAVQRSAAARALGAGYGGSGMHRNLVARDLGTTSLGLQGQGLSWLNALRSLSPTVTPQSAFNFTGPDAAGYLNIRGQERAQRMKLLAQAAGIPGQTAAWANYLTQTGGALTGAGLSGGFGGFGGGSGGGVSMNSAGMGLG